MIPLDETHLSTFSDAEWHWYGLIPTGARARRPATSLSFDATIKTVCFISFCRRGMAIACLHENVCVDEQPPSHGLPCASTFTVPFLFLSWMDPWKCLVLPVGRVGPSDTRAPDLSCMAGSISVAHPHRGHVRATSPPRSLVGRGIRPTALSLRPLPRGDLILSPGCVVWSRRRVGRCFLPSSFDSNARTEEVWARIVPRTPCPPTWSPT